MPRRSKFTDDRQLELNLMPEKLAYQFNLLPDLRDRFKYQIDPSVQAVILQHSPENGATRVLLTKRGRGGEEISLWLERELSGSQSFSERALAVLYSELEAWVGSGVLRDEVDAVVYHANLTGI